MTWSGSVISVKRGCTSKMPRCKADDTSEGIRIDGLVHILAATVGHSSLAAVGSAGNAGMFELDWNCGC